MKITTRDMYIEADNINNGDISVFSDGSSYKGAIRSFNITGYHKVDGPACEFSGVETWKFEGKLHRKYGPACKSAIESWWFEGVIYSQEEFMGRFL